MTTEKIPAPEPLVVTPNERLALGEEADITVRAPGSGAPPLRLRVRAVRIDAAGSTCDHCALDARFDGGDMCALHRLCALDSDIALATEDEIPVLAAKGVLA